MWSGVVVFLIVCCCVCVLCVVICGRLLICACLCVVLPVYDYVWLHAKGFVYVVVCVLVRNCMSVVVCVWLCV